MYPSLPQIVTSLGRLSDVHPFFGYGYLGLKLADIPVGETQEFHYSYIRTEILDPYFKFSGVKGYYNPFKSPKHWVSERYDSTSLQRVIADTFSSAFIREPEAHGWGWVDNYIDELAYLQEATRSSKIPLFDIAVWYGRNHDLGDVSDSEATDVLIDGFKRRFSLSSQEIDLLFDSLSRRQVDLDLTPASDKDLLSFIGYPPNQSADRAVSLSKLTARNVGPFAKAEYLTSKRLNIIAGDNSLGKTFLLELIWWSLTGQWNLYPAEPQDANKPAEIEIQLDMSLTRSSNILVPFNRIDGVWQRSSLDLDSPVIFFSFDGGVNINLPRQYLREVSNPSSVRLDRDRLLYGIQRASPEGKVHQVSNGLIRDVVLWQLLEERYPGRRAVFERALTVLSPPGTRHLRLGQPARIRGDSREFPTVRLPYGEVPFPYLSAGIQKAFIYAYVMAWTFFEFLDPEKFSEGTSSQMIVLIDEIEAHLHPKWQRRIVPAFLAALKEMLPTFRCQLHIATHSPLVMASLEEEADPLDDAVHLVQITRQNVTVDSQPFVKMGSVNRWLESEIFGLGAARSTSAEIALSAANALMSERNVSLSVLDRVEKHLIDALPDDDPFWVRWNRFATYHRKVD